MDSEKKEVNKPEKQPFKDKDVVLTLYTDTITDLRMGVERVWSNMKFFTSITTSLLGLSAGFLGLFLEKLDVVKSLHGVVAFFIIFPVLIIIVSVIGWLNLKREYELVLKSIVMAIKIRERLGLYNHGFPSHKFTEEYLFKKEDTERISSDKFIKDKLKEPDTLFAYFTYLHLVYVGLAVYIYFVVVSHMGYDLFLKLLNKYL
jgi:hypothetical protein